MGVARIGELVGSPVWGIVYHFLLLLAVEAALAMAWGEWRRSLRDQAQRLLMALAGLSLLRLFYLLAMPLAANWWTDAVIVLPPLERFVDTASIALLGWAFVSAARRGGRTWDLIFGANLVAAVIACMVFVALWTQSQATAVSPDYNDSWQGAVWGLWQIALILLSGVAVVQDRDQGWGVFLAAMVALLTGRLLELFVPSGVPNLPLWDRLSNLVAYLLIVVAVYQSIVDRMYLHSQHLEEISQASLDQIKSLLYLFETRQQVSASLDLDMVLDKAAQGIARALGADQCAVALPDVDDRGQMRLVAIYNPERQARSEGVTFPLQYQHAVQQVMRRKKHVLIDDAQNVQLRVLFALMGSSQVGPLLIVPLLSGGQAMGVLIVGNSRSQRPFTPNEAKLCQSMAEQLVNSIQNARRYQEVQQRLVSLKEEMAAGATALGEAQDQVRELSERLTALNQEAAQARRQEERAREERNALELVLARQRAEVESLSERLAAVEAELRQAQADAAAQLRWHEEELARREAAWREGAQASGWLQPVLEGMRAGIVIADAKGAIQEANVAAELLLERSGDELRSVSLAALSDDQRWKNAVKAAMDGQVVRLTMPMGLKTLMCELAPLEGDLVQGGPGGVIALWQDISAEAEAQRERLETLSALAREMLSPVTSVTNHVDLILSEAVGAVNDTHRRFLLRVRAAAERMVQMIEDLIQQAGNGKWPSLERQAVDMGELLKETVAGASRRYEDRALAVALDLPEDLPTVEADPDSLRRVLTNLLSNACLASARGGRVEVWAAHSKDLPFASDEWHTNGKGFVIVSIKDAGGGLTDDALSRIFDRRRPSQTPPGLGESGAGLALVKDLIEAHGGRLWVENEEGVGTIFNFVLPVEQGDSQA